ncbi:GntR family transcriptional regulator [Extibacter sp. GGCC_0201]|uniref:GntR family transcriptional regulator n=1 Tax=Extibacter sp. GGCC_0201 TaxID=2731209 RepID=UPI001AA1A66E
MKTRNLDMMIYGYLLTRIHYGFYREEEPLPSAQRLGKLFNVSDMAARGAYRLLEKDGCILNVRGRRTVAGNHIAEQEKTNLDKFIVSEELMQDILCSFDLIFPEVFFYGLNACSEKEIHKLYGILDRPALSWDEPTLDFLAHVIKGLKNPLLIDLYYDVALLTYPAFLSRLGKSKEGWEEAHRELSPLLYELLRVREEGNRRTLWSQIARRCPAYNTEKGAVSEDTYEWGRRRTCLVAAGKILYKINSGEYPVDTFLPSARILAEQTSTPIITMRRAIALLNDLGMAESVNGKGTRVISSEKGRRRVKWRSPALNKNVRLYLYSVHILAITSQSLAVRAFPLMNVEKRRRIKNDIECLLEREEHAGTISYICIKALMDEMDLPSLREIYNKLLQYLILGQPLSCLQPYLNMDGQARELMAGLESGDALMFGVALKKSFFVMFSSSKTKAAFMGIEGLEELTLPF